MLGLVPESDWEPVGVSELEPTADEAVKSFSNTLVVAGPGAGKTELLAQKASFLFETGKCCWPHRVLAISFKKDAAKNLGERVSERCGDNSDRFVSLTLDSFAKNLVDRFRLALPAEWRPNSDYKVRTTGISPDEAFHWLEGVEIPPEIPPVGFGKYNKGQLRKIMDTLVHGVELPYDSESTKPLLRLLGRQWWSRQLQVSSDNPSLTFPMLSRLAAFLLRQNPKICRAIRYTYSNVFLDEFQDTTGSQWDLVRAAFMGSDSVLTAVGDNKQRIMVWAGALEDVFEKFSEDFGASQLDLVRNYRSVPELVRIQRDIAKAVESTGEVAVVEARSEGDGICSVYEFSCPEHEAVFFADLISREIQEGHYEVRDYCVLVRQRTGDMVAQLRDELQTRGIRLRDESILQDLRTEPLTTIVLSLVALATRKRDADAWEVLCSSLIDLIELDEDGIKLESLAVRHIDAVRQCLGSGEGIKGVPEAVVAVMGADRYRAVFGQYAVGDYLDSIMGRLGEVLDEALDEIGDVAEVVDLIIGHDVIPAMTIHKSKGLEFETVIFLGLEDGQWWNFRMQPEEEKRAFFVAFSRAKSRAFFSLSDLRDTAYGRRRQSKNDVGDLHDILISAGVEVFDKRE